MGAGKLPAPSPILMAVTAAYKRYLKSPAWARKRQQVFEFYGKRCYVCKTRKGPIQVHHLTYRRLGNELMADVRPLCFTCHREIGRLHWKLGKRKSGAYVLSE